MHARFTQLAIVDLQAVADHLLDNASVSVALSVTDNIEATINQTLLEHQKIGECVSFAGKDMRYFPASKYDTYNIFYTVEDDHILVVRILHGKRDVHRIFADD